MATHAPGRALELSDEEMVELLELISESDSVELKTTVPASAQRGTVSTLGLDPLEAQIRQVFFFDTPDLQLNRAGVVVRARRIQGKAHDAVVKLRPVVPSELPEHLRRSPELTVEVDALPGGYVCSAALKTRVGKTEIRECVHGELALRELFSKRQRSFYADHAPTGIGLDSLSVLGPIFVLKLKFAPTGLDRKMVAEIWLYPDGSRILELSTKCSPDEAFQVAVESRAFLARRGIDISGEQATKTKAALEFFSGELRSEAG